MQFKQLKALILATSAIAGLTFLATDAKAANPETMNASIESVAAITATNLNDMNFGKWIFAHDGAGGDIVLALDTTGAIVSTPGGTSTATQIDPGDPGRISINIPAGINNYLVQMDASAITDFADTDVNLSLIEYRTATEAEAALGTPSTDNDVTVVTGGVPEVIFFGGTLTVTDTPAAGVDADASFTLTFDY